MSFARIIRVVFGAIAGVMLVAALGDILWSGRLSLISPLSFGALVAVALELEQTDKLQVVQALELEKVGLGYK